MKQYSILHPLYLSFFSRDLYRVVRSSWKGKGFLYLLLLLAITWLPVMYKFHRGVAEGVGREAPKYIDQVPKITIVRGEVSIDRPVPYTITDPDSREPLVVIDTSGQITSLEQTTAPMLLTRDKFIYREAAGGPPKIYDLSGIQAFTLDRDMVNGWVRLFTKYFAVFAYPFAVAGSYVYRLLQALLYAAIGLIFVRTLKARLDYGAVLQLALVAITPAVILSTLIRLAGLAIPVFWLICFLLAMGYLFFAVKANAAPTPPKEP